MPNVEAAEESLETTFQSFEVVSNTSIESLLMQPHMSGTAMMDICLWGLRDDSGLQRILCLAWCHERMRDAEEPVHVVTSTLTWHSAHLTCWNDMILVVHPPVVYIIIQDL